MSTFGGFEWQATGFVTKILSALGIVDSPSDNPGFSEASASASAGDGGKGAAFLDAFSAFRDEVSGNLAL